MFSYETKYCFAIQVVSGYYVYLRTSDGDRLIDHVFDPREAEEARRKEKEAELRERREIEALQRTKESLERIGWPLQRIKADKEGAIAEIEKAQMRCKSNREFDFLQKWMDFVVQC